MSDPQELHSYAEVAITLAGLTGIIGAIQKGSKAEWPKRELLHIVNLLMMALLTVVLAFIPTIIAKLPAGGADIWVVSVQALFVVHLAGWLIFLAFSQRGRIVLNDLPKIEKNIAYVLLSLGLAALIFELTIILGFFTGFAPALYEAVLLLFLVAGLFNFTYLLLGTDHAGT